MALKIKIGKEGLPVAGNTIHVYYANTSVLVPFLKTQDGTNADLPNPFIIDDEEWWGFETPNSNNIDVWWVEGSQYVIRDVNVNNPNSLVDPFPQYVLHGEETDPIFTAWDKSTDISITLSQVSDWNDVYQEVLVSGSNIKTINGQSLLGEGDLQVFGEREIETDPIFMAWDKSTGITITESQISDLGDYNAPLLSGSNIKTINGQSLLGEGNLEISVEETDPIFTAWDKSTGINIYQIQVVDLYSTTNVDLQTDTGEEDLYIETGISDLNEYIAYQEKLVNGVNIKTLNGYSVLGNGNLYSDLILTEVDPVFTAWDKSTGITITESQIIDLSSYQDQLVSGTNIKTINGESVLGEGNLFIGTEIEETDPVFNAWDKSTGITITESQITDLGNYQEQLVSSTNIKTINGQSVLGSGSLEIYFDELLETDPVFNGWDKSTGITITESQVTDLGNYQEQLVSGVNIKTVNGQSVLTSEPMYIIANELTNEEMVLALNNYLGDTSWQNGNSGIDISIGDVVATYIPVVPSNWLLCDGSKYNIVDYPTLANVMQLDDYVEQPEKLYSFGYNGFGQLGLGNITTMSSPVQVGSLTDWNKLNGGSDHSVSIKNDGSLWGWGQNSYGQLGLGNINNYSSPVQIGSLTNWSQIACGERFTVSIKTDNSLWSWGRNNYGQLGLGNITTMSSPVQVGSLTDWSQITCGQNHSLAIKTDGSLWGWGFNEYGQLGLGDVLSKSSPVQVGSLTDWNKIACGGGHSVAIKTDGTLWSWGSNDFGQLGLNNKVNYSSPVQVGADNDWTQINCGWDHTVAIKVDGTLWSWGLNNYGQLGLGDISLRRIPTKVGNLNNWKTVSCGKYYYTLATRENGTLWSWGYNGYGQLGLNNRTSYSSPVQVGSLTNWTDIATGNYFVLGKSGSGYSTFHTPIIPSRDNEKWYIYSGSIGS